MKNFFAKNSIKLLALMFLLAPIFVSTQVVYGQAEDSGFNFVEDSGLNQSADSGGFVTGEDAATVDNIIGRIITIVLSMVGVMFLAFAIYGGVVWMTAYGNEEKVKTANKIIMNALFGIIIVLSAYVVSYFLIKYFA
jgi:hypothetical protein